MKALLAAFVLALPMLARAESPTRLACVGDSITAGYALKHPQRDSYPARLARMVLPGWEVRNFGVSGATLMTAGNMPYVRQKAYPAALAWKPDVVVIALGTNDTKTMNIGAHPEDFVPSYRVLIASFRKANPQARIFLCLPPPAFPAAMGISNQILVDHILPLIRQVAAEEKLPLIDLHTPFKADGADFPDKIHPDPEAAKQIAEIVGEAVGAVGAAIAPAAR
ncbi:MAG TPA: GDSL-type esterase/lipase family protein [Opitutaceae bacterium]|nr:GDSL-type esterase/lipase family protein [Opitutaceae bacterium]